LLHSMDSTAKQPKSHPQEREFDVLLAIGYA
jgi:hypothetical protein